MKITTKNIIKILPVDGAIREKFAAQFEKFSPEKKFEAEKMLWGYFDAIYGLKLEENTQLALLSAEKGEEKLNKNFYKKVREKTERDIENLFIEGVESKDLEEARKAMEFIVKEMKASKKVAI